jgi:hypothetical protein
MGGCAPSKPSKPSNQAELPILYSTAKLSFKDLFDDPYFTDGLLSIGKECLNNTDPCEHPNCKYIRHSGDVINLGTLSANLINKGLNRGLTATYDDNSESLEELKTHFLL